MGRCDDLGLLGRCKRVAARRATQEEVIHDADNHVQDDVDDNQGPGEPQRRRFDPS